ncbi:MAG: DUF4424 family protein [Rhizobiales bacterium]|nr:DUF4424 family protein [Hyphomicrobiales bacterium]
MTAFASRSNFKGSTDNLVSFCGEGVEKIAATRFEIRETDFWPAQNMEILFLQRYSFENTN